MDWTKPPHECLGYGDSIVSRLHGMGRLLQREAATRIAGGTRCADKRQPTGAGLDRSCNSQARATTVFLHAGHESAGLATSSDRGSRIMTSRWPADNGRRILAVWPPGPRGRVDTGDTGVRSSRSALGSVRGNPVARRRGGLVRPHAEQTPALGQFLFAPPAREKSAIANALEPVWQDVEEKPPDEFFGRQGHRPDFVGVTIILPPESHLVVLDIEQAVVGDGHAMGIAAHVVPYLLRPGERALGIDHPLRALRLVQAADERRTFAKLLEYNGENYSCSCSALHEYD